MLGAIIGDVVGSRFEFNNIKTKEFDLFKKNSSYMTDDTIMTIAVDEILLKKWNSNQDKIVKTLKKWGQKYPNAGYGGSFYHWVLSSNPLPYYSYGNGAAMRISAAGWFGDSEKEVKQLSKEITEVTHDHPEGLKGAEVTAMCIFMARKGKTKKEILEYVVNEYPEILDLDYEELRKTYVHGEEICQVTVPQAIYCFLISNSFEDCLRTTISIGGDCDTTAAISCAIAEAFYGLDIEIVKQLSTFLTDDVKNVILKVYKKLNRSDYKWIAEIL